jgi:Tfp pilus assembly protein PilO
MGRLIIPVLLLILSFGSYFLYTKPIYSEAKDIKTEVTKLKDADAKLTVAISKKDKLATTYNSLDTSLIDRLTKLMPDNLDNIKLIIDVDRAAKQYGMILNAVKFDVDQQAKQEALATTGRITADSAVVRDNKAALELKKDYNNFSLTMTTTGTFANFTKLVSDMEKNLRIIDITSVTFDAQDLKDVYKFEIKAKIYWLKPMATGTATAAAAKTK